MNWRNTGLEFEFSENNIFNQDKAIIFLKNNFVSINKEYNQNFNNWTVKLDASCGFEVTTSIIETKEDFYVIKKIFDNLNSSFKEEDIINNQCGLHVHIEIEDFESSQCLRNLLDLTSFLEKKIIYKIINKNRINNRYCKSINNYSQKLNGLSNNIFKLKEIINFKFERNRGLNIQALSKFGTAEFRYHHATLNYEEIKNWVLLLQAIVEYSSFPENNIEIKKMIKNNIQLEEISSILGLEKETIDYIKFKKQEGSKNYVWNVLFNKK